MSDPKAAAAEVLSAGYSYHIEKFVNSSRSGLRSYLFRLQTEGQCRVLIDGVWTLIRPGDLLLFAPGDPYELRVEPEEDGDVGGEGGAASGGPRLAEPGAELSPAAGAAGETAAARAEPGTGPLTPAPGRAEAGTARAGHNAEPPRAGVPETGLPPFPVASGDYYLFAGGSWVDAWWKRAALPHRTAVTGTDKLAVLWRQIIMEKRNLHVENAELTDYLLRALCLQLERSVREAGSLPARSRGFLAYRMKHYVEEHAVSPLRLEDVAAHVGLSVSRAVHLFKAVFGMTLMQYALDIRLTLAVERMQYSKLTLEQVAETCGFGSYSYFHRAFRAKYGLSPKEYRAKHLELG